MPAAAATPELLAADGDDLDPAMRSSVLVWMTQVSTATTAISTTGS